MGGYTMIKCNKCSKELDEDKFEKGRKTCRRCRMNSKRKHKINCGYCEISFKSLSKNTKFCSRECVSLSRRRRVEVNCFLCGKTKSISESEYKLREKHFCNQGCRSESLRKEMQGEGNPNYNSVKTDCDGCGCSIKVRPFELKSLKHHFCSRDCFIDNIGKYYSGENNSNWNPEITNEERNELRRYPEYYRWRTSVFKRDSYTCQVCGNSESGNLNAHHIENYSSNVDKRTNIKNGITLCIPCHTEFHKTYGYFNNNARQLDLFIVSKNAELAYSE